MGCSSSIPCKAIHQNSRYLDGEKIGTKSGVRKARKPIVQFRVSRTVSEGDFRKLNLLQMAALRNTKFEEALTVSSGKKLMF